MTWHKRRRVALLRVSLTVLLALAVAACGDAATPTPASLSATDVRDLAVEALGNVSTFAFEVEHEGPPTIIGGGLELKSASGTVALPDRAETLAKADIAALGLPVELGIIQIGEKGYMQDPFSGVWLSANSLPFVFHAINVAVADVLRAASEPTLVGDAVGGFVLEATLPSDALRALVPAAAEGLSLTVRVWVDEGDFLVSRIRLSGPILDGEGPDMVRVVEFSGYDEPVVIEPPL